LVINSKFTIPIIIIPKRFPTMYCTARQLWKTSRAFSHYSSGYQADSCVHV